MVPTLAFVDILVLRIYYPFAAFELRVVCVPHLHSSYRYTFSTLESSVCASASPVYGARYPSLRFRHAPTHPHCPPSPSFPSFSEARSPPVPPPPPSPFPTLLHHPGPDLIRPIKNTKPHRPIPIPGHIIPQRAHPLLQHAPRRLVVVGVPGLEGEAVGAPGESAGRDQAVAFEG